MASAGRLSFSKAKPRPRLRVGPPGTGRQSVVESRKTLDGLVVSAGRVLQGAEMELGGVGQGTARLARHGQKEPLGLLRLVLFLQRPAKSETAIVLHVAVGEPLQPVAEVSGRRRKIVVRQGNVAQIGQHVSDEPIAADTSPGSPPGRAWRRRSCPPSRPLRPIGTARPERTCPRARGRHIGENARRASSSLPNWSKASPRKKTPWFARRSLGYLSRNV